MTRVEFLSSNTFCSVIHKRKKMNDAVMNSAWQQNLSVNERRSVYRISRGGSERTTQSVSCNNGIDTITSVVCTVTQHELRECSPPKFSRARVSLKRKVSAEGEQHLYGLIDLPRAELMIKNFLDKTFFFLPHHTSHHCLLVLIKSFLQLSN